MKLQKYKFICNPPTFFSQLIKCDKNIVESKEKSVVFTLPQLIVVI
jgi:hypothetical protein